MSPTTYRVIVNIKDDRTSFVKLACILVVPTLGALLLHFLAVGTSAGVSFYINVAWTSVFVNAVGFMLGVAMQMKDWKTLTQRVIDTLKEGKDV